MKTQEQTKEWFLSAVKASLVLNFGVQEEEAVLAMKAYGLREIIEANPDELENSIDGLAETIARFEFLGRPSQLSYKGFFTEVKYDTQLRTLYGRVYGIKEFVSFEAPGIELVEKEFHRVVDEYLAYGEVSKPEGPEEPAEIREEPFAAFKEGMSDADFLKALGIDPEERTVEPQKEEPFVFHEEKIDGRKVLGQMSDEAFLREMGIDPDDVIL